MPLKGTTTGSSYENELKRILEGRPLPADMRSLSPPEKNAYYLLEKHPFLVIRAAGSFGCDLVALRPDVAFPIEVKSSKSEVVRFGGRREQQQAVDFMTECRRPGVIPVYAHRLKGIRGDKWRLFRLPVDRATGFDAAGTLAFSLPVLPRTKAGNFKLDWYKGLPLWDLILRLSEL